MSISQCGSWARLLPTLCTVLALACTVSGYASPLQQDSKDIHESYQQAVASPLRTDEDRSADAARKPLEFLQFSKVTPGMLALDIAAGGGYTSQLLALAVGHDGKVWAQNAQSRPAIEQRLAKHPQPNMVPVVRPYEDPIPDGIPKLDLITVIMNYHDIAYMPVDRAKMDQRLFNALKPGGHLVVMDHSAKAGSGISAAKSLHRIDEKVVLDEFLQAGFKLEQSGDFLKNPADPRDEAFFNMKIPTDKFALRFVKP